VRGKGGVVLMGRSGKGFYHMGSTRFIFLLLFTFLLGGCEGAEDPCVQHQGIYGTEPYYYYTGDCGEGVTMANPTQPSVPYMIQFDNSFLHHNAVKPKN
jgi:hypothetical protein